MCNTHNNDIEIRKFTAKVVFDLSQILDVEESWKQLMANIPDLESGKAKYNVEQINLIEKSAENQRRSSAEILLEEWGTSGSKRPHISDLLNVLIKAELFRAADYVSKLLNKEPPARPSFGPAASVNIPEDLEPSAPPLSLWGSECLKDTIPLQLQKKELINCGDIVPHVAYEILQYGTNDFSDNKKLGTGGFGSVYLCHLNSKQMAVKRLHDTEAAVPGLADKQFGTEIKLLGGVSHQNILSIIGYSEDGPFKCLVYSYMPNGSLQDALECKKDKNILKWKERLSICLGTAKGLEYLHTMEKPLIHRDLKSANILLDENLIPKVGDFGLVKAANVFGKSFSMHTSTVVGTSAYMSPEAFKGEISPKGDVFSFGVVLLEIITGLPPYDEERDSYDLLSYVNDVEDINALVDKRLEIASEALIEGLYILSQKCCDHYKKSRPTMTEVLVHLDKLPNI